MSFLDTTQENDDISENGATTPLSSHVPEVEENGGTI